MKVTGGFTLVELLVVVTITVVLLALLTPAIDKALYSAELAVCGSNLHAITAAAIAYAAGSQRHYPHRAIPGYGWENIRLSIGGQPPTNRVDDRPLLRSFLRLNSHLQDPLTEAVDLDSPGSEVTVYTPYTLWFSWRWLAHGDRGMYRMGDRFTWSEPGQSRATFRLLASDWEDAEPAANLVFGSHPDKDGLMRPYTFDNEPSPWALAGENATLTWWRIDNAARGPIDMNFGYDDGSVVRIDDVAWDEQKRLTRVPDFANKASTSGGTDRWYKIPAK